MKKGRHSRNRRFENVLRRLRYRRKVMRFEQGEHSQTPHTMGLCCSCERGSARLRIMDELIEELGGRA